MTRPSKLPTWATDDLYPVSSESFSATNTKTEPSSGKKAEGWEPGEPPPAQYMNWWNNNVYQWLAWLAAGNLDGNFTVDGNLTVTGTTTLESGVSITGNETLSGNLSVGGNESLTGNLTVGGSATVTGTVTGSGLRYTAPDTITIGFTLGQPPTAEPARCPTCENSLGWQSGDGLDLAVEYPITLPAGTRIRSWAVRCWKGSGIAQGILCQLWARSSGAGPGLVQTQIGSDQESFANAPGNLSLGENFTAPYHTLGATDHYFVRVQSFDPTTNNDYFGDLIISVDRPA